MSLDGGFEEFDGSLRAEANCLSNSSIRANAAASCSSNSATRSANRAQFRHFPCRIFMTRQSTQYRPIPPIPIHRGVNGDTATLAFSPICETMRPTRPGVIGLPL
jgi:hypothetical protein